MRNRKQNGMVVRIGDRWYVRYWERRNVDGSIERKRVTHQLGPVTTRGKRPPADIVNQAQGHMATVNSGAIPAERIVTVNDFVERVYLPWIEQHNRPSTAKGYRDIWEDHLKPLCANVWLRDTPNVPRSGLAQSDRGGHAEPEHPQARQERHQRHIYPCKAAGLFPMGKPCPRHLRQS